MRNEALHPYKAKNKVTVPYILISVSFILKRTDKKFCRELFQLLPEYEYNVTIYSSLLKLSIAVSEDLMDSSNESVHVH